MGVTHLTGLSITADPRGGTGIEVTGTTRFNSPATLAGAATLSSTLALTGAATLSGGATLTGVNTYRFGRRPLIQIASAGTGSICGRKIIGTAGTGVVNTIKVRASSRIFLNPSVKWGGAQAQRFLTNVSTQATGSSFTIRLARLQTSGTPVGATGAVDWWIINP